MILWSKSKIFIARRFDLQFKKDLFLTNFFACEYKLDTPLETVIKFDSVCSISTT